MTTTPREGAQPRHKQCASTGRLSAVMFIGQFGWATVGAACGTLLAALAAEAKPEDKVDLLALLTTTGAIAAVICMILAGTLSDRTQSKLGPRNPWIIGGAIVGTLAFACIGLTRNPALLVVAHMVYQGGLNCMLGAFNAIPPDYIPDSTLGKVSAFGGAGYLLAQIIGVVIAGAFVTHPSQGFLMAAWIMLVSSIIVVILLPPHPLRHRSPRPPVIWRQFGAQMRPPSDGQFWWILVGRFLFVISLFMVMQFQLYIATDEMGMTRATAGRLIAMNSAVLAVTAVVLDVITGPWSDKIKRRKPFTMIAPLVAGAGVIPLFLVNEPWTLTIFAAMGGAAFGTYMAVDGALMVEVLPDRDDAARDLGFLNAANSLPIVFAPGIGAALVKTVGYPGLFTATIILAILGSLCITRVTRVK